jgi:flagellin
MALGVLNNLSAIYAENNLNKTSSSLQTVLQQLSSGSRINSGADDSAGLSLVNGLAANSAALTQSTTNVSEGVGLLQVADGALSQVTSLLDRAITLATEASNGTLNSAQDGAANNEYRSIMAEINNIGSTTTYNQQSVFSGVTTAIYTGDSSTQGSSVDDLNIRTLSSSSVGDTAGVMSYSSGADNVFIDLSNSGHNAALSDSLNASGATTVNVTYMTKGAGGAATAATAPISVGAGTSYQNTVQDLISAINNAGLGLTASFGTAAEAGDAAAATASAANNGGGGETDTGIIISSAGIGTGTNGAGVVGALSLTPGDTLGGTLSIVGSDGANHNIPLGTANSTDTLNNLEATINSAGYGVTAALNQDGTQLTFTTVDPKVTITASNLTQNTASIPSTITVGGSGLGSLTVGSSGDTLTGILDIQEGADGKNTVSQLNLAGQTLAQLQNTIDSGGYGIDADLAQNGTVLTFTKAATGDLGTAAISVHNGSSITDVATPTVLAGGTLGSLTVAAAGDTLGAGTLTIKAGTTGATSTVTLGSYAAGTDTLANLAKTITNGGYGITAAVDPTGTILTFTQTSGTNTAGITGSGIDNTYTQSPINLVAGQTLGSITLNGANDTLATGTPGQGIVLSGNAAGVLGTLTVVNSTSSAAADAEQLSGTLNLKDSTGAAQTINLATAGAGATPLTLATLATYLTTGAGSGWGITATYNPSAPGTLDTANIVFSSASANAAVVASPGLSSASAGNVSVTASNVATTTLDLGSAPMTLAALKGEVNAVTADYGITAAITGDTLTFTQTSGAGVATVGETGVGTDTTPAHNTTASVVVTSNNTLGSLSVNNASDLLTGTIHYTPATVAGVATSYNLIATGETLAQIAADFDSNSGAVGSAKNIVATLNPDGKSLVFTESASAPSNAVAPSVSTPIALADDPAVTPGATLGSLSANNADDTLTGSFTIQEGADGKNTSTTLDFTNQTLAQIEQTINTGGYGITATSNPGGNGLVAGTLLTFTQNASDAGTAGITNNGVVVDTAPAVTNPAVNVTNPAGPNIGTLSAVTSGDMLSGSFSIVSATGVSSTYSFQGQNLAEIAQSFNQPPDEQNDNIGITATLNGSGTMITFTVTAGGTPSISGVGIKDVTPASSVNQEVNTGTILNTLTVAHSSDALGGFINIVEGVDTNGTPATLNLGGQTIAQIEADFDTTTGTHNWSTYGITASINNNTLTLSQTLGDLGTANVTKNGLITDQIQSTSGTQTLTGPTMLNTLQAANAGDPLSGTLTIQEGADAKATTSTYNLAGQTIDEIVAAFTTGAEANLGITATENVAKTQVTFSQTPGDLGTAKVTTPGTILDGTFLNATPISVATGTMLDTLSVNNSADLLGGTLNLTSGFGGTSTLPLGALGTTDTLADLAADFTTGAEKNLGIAAALNPAGTEITFTQSGGGFPAAVGGTSISDSDGINIAPSASLGSLTVSTADDTLSGALTGVKGDGTTPYTINLGIGGSTDTLQDLEHTINVTDAAYGITANLNPAGTSLSFSATNGDSGTPTLGNEGTITDTTPALQTPISLTKTPTSGSVDSTTLGSLSILSTDTLSGSITIGNNTIDIGSTNNSAPLLTAAINKGDYGVTASYNSGTGAMTFVSPNSALSVDTGNLDATVLNGSVAAGVGALTGVVSTSSSYYSIGISGNITDTSAAVTVGNTTTYGGTANVGITADSNGAGGIATMGYSDSAGQSLSGTDLLNQTDAESALNELNVAITDAAAQDGYIGAQINTLNSISQVMSTQQENVLSAQNAIQATDYASATSNMSKYEILSQTGIAALAQANSVQQEVTKLLQ